MVNAISKSTRLKVNGKLVFLKVISHVSAISGPDPLIGKVDSERETVVIKEKELNCNL